MFFKRKTFQTLNIIELDSKALLHNLHYIQSINPGYSIFPTIKGNAYWHGIREIAKILSSEKLEYICVDSYFEALKVREVTSLPILIMGYTLPHNYAVMKLSSFTFFVYDEDSINALGKLGKSVKIHLKIDTGMARQWARLDALEDLLNIIKSYPKLRLEGIATHLADADGVDNSYSLHQIKEFKTAIALCENKAITLKYKHISNTAWSMKFTSWDFNALRLGIGLYWVNPFASEDPFYEKAKELKPVLSLYTTLVAKKKIKKWEKVSYNCTFTATRDMIIWVVPIGYYEALWRKLSSNYSMYFEWQELPIVGRVCMNLTMLDIGDTDMKVGERIEVIGTDMSKNNNIYSMARRSETIPYECLTRISETIRREIV